jgi:hypothetical protein
MTAPLACARGTANFANFQLEPPSGKEALQGKGEFLSERWRESAGLRLERFKSREADRTNVTGFTPVTVPCV